MTCHMLFQGISGIEENKLIHIWPLSGGATAGYFLPKGKKLKGINISLAHKARGHELEFFLFQIIFNSHAFVGSNFFAYFSCVGEKNLQRQRAGILSMEIALEGT